jgi:hypothetical protein
LIAALYVETGGAYFGLEGVDPWDEVRDARKYDGPWPVVAHPPCQRWGKMWFGQPGGKRKKLGDDGGCFEAALSQVRKFGGVIEHPWSSLAWPHFGLTVPERSGGWIMADFLGGWTCCVEQGAYGHYARKPTLLYVFGVAPADLPSLDWGYRYASLDPEVIERIGLEKAKKRGEVAAKGGGVDSSHRVGTPAPFRELLISIAAMSRVK